MRLYMVRAWVNEWHMKGGYAHPYKHEEVFTKIKIAKAVFNDCVNEVKTWEGLSGIHSVKVTLFTPHIFDSGQLASYPASGKYIKIYNPYNL